MLLERCLIALKTSCSVCLMTDPPKRNDQWQSADRKGYAPNPEAVPPGSAIPDNLQDLTTDPSVDNEWSCWNVGKEKAGPERSRISNNDLDNQHDGRVSDLVEATADGKSGGTVRRSFNSSASSLSEKCTSSGI